MITHNEFTAGLYLVGGISSGTVGLLIGSWRRSRRERLLLDDAYDDGYDRGWEDRSDRDVHRLEEEERRFPGGARPVQEAPEPVHPDFASRRTMLLEPGGTTYPALVALAEQAMDRPVRHAEPVTSTWYRTTWLDLERRYPIPLDSPRESMTEALR